MSSITGYFNDAAAAGEAGYGLYNQIERAINGSGRKVFFVRNNSTLVEFDVILNEGHQFAVGLTSFPVELGYTITDHATVAPIQLSLTGLVSDYPVETKNQLINSTITSVATAVTTPLGALGVLGATVGYSTLIAQGQSFSRNAKVFNDLQVLAGVKTEQSKVAVPQVFDVVTRLRRYPSMMITSLQLNRDSTSGPTCAVFTVNLQQVQLAYAQTVLLQTAIPAKAASKKKLGEAEEEANKALSAASQGVADGKSLVSQADPLVDSLVNALPGSSSVTAP